MDVSSVKNLGGYVPFWTKSLVNIRLNSVANERIFFEAPNVFLTFFAKISR